MNCVAISFRFAASQHAGVGPQARSFVNDIVSRLYRVLGNRDKRENIRVLQYIKSLNSLCR